MDISDPVALVTGANGGIGRAFVAELLKRGAAKIYVAARDTAALRDLVRDGDGRLCPLPLDVTDPDQVVAAARDDFRLAIGITAFVHREVHHRSERAEGEIHGEDLILLSIASASAAEGEGVPDRMRGVFPWFFSPTLKNRTWPWRF